MPSLRRTFSSPAVRSSPYPSSSPSSALYNATRTQSHGHRRSFGSDLHQRRVLADIEWWKVADGQHADQGHDNDPQVQRDRVSLPEQPRNAATLALELDSLSSSWASENSLLITSLPEEPLMPPTDQFSELSITPRTPAPDDDDSAPSSVLATPEADFLPLEGLTFRYDTCRIPSSKQKRHRSVTMPVFPTKTKLFDDLFFNDFGDFADFTVSPLSSQSPLLFN
ncbi:hypothetical protein APHAL10511_000955 [Amanita phalloides]|nr:hypothetical protein APHAL10511_000955 [Amanita phalloides]